jgi:hypothetical protein
MKGATMRATLGRLGVVPSFSRPRVSDSKPYSEALFRTPDDLIRGVTSRSSNFARWCIRPPAPTTRNACAVTPSTGRARPRRARMWPIGERHRRRRIERPRKRTFTLAGVWRLAGRTSEQAPVTPSSLQRAAQLSRTASALISQYPAAASPAATDLPGRLAGFWMRRISSGR